MPQVHLKLEELVIFKVVVVGDDRNAIVDLVDVAVCIVVNKKDVFRLSVHDDVQIFDVHTVFYFNTVFSTENEPYIFLIWVEISNDFVSVDLGRSSVHPDFIDLRHVLQNLASEWPDVDACLC